MYICKYVTKLPVTCKVYKFKYIYIYIYINIYIYANYSFLKLFKS